MRSAFLRIELNALVRPIALRVTNTVSWVFDPGYVKNFGGLLQALTVGLPAYSATPTWMFFRNTILSDLFFTLLFVACMNFGRKTSRARAGAALPRVA